MVLADLHASVNPSPNPGAALTCPQSNVKVQDILLQPTLHS
jgi:hypothetical protein